MLTTIIAIWGAATGSISLFMKYLDFRKTKPRLRIELSESFHSFVVPSNYLKIHGLTYDSDSYSAVISLKIENNSRQPVTINKLEYKYHYINGIKWCDVQICQFDLKIFEKEKGVDSQERKISTRVSLPLAPMVKLPIRLDAYDSISFKFYTPFLDKNFIQDGCFKSELKIHTPSKIHHINLSVPEIHQIVPNLDTYTQHK